MPETQRPLLLVSGEYPPDTGGVADYTARLREALGRRGLHAEVFTRSRADGARQGGWGPGAVLSIARHAPRGAVVHLQYQAAAYDLRGEICLLPLLLRAARRDVRSVTTFHDARVPYVFPKAGPLRRQALMLLARSSHAVVAADPSDLAVLGGPSPRHHQIPIGSNVACLPPAGYDRDDFRTRLGLRNGDLAVGYFGFRNASKGLETLLHAFEQVLQRQPSARLFLLGGRTGASDVTDYETAAAFEQHLRALAGHVVATGHLPPEDLSAHLLALDVALLPYADGASPRRGSLLACAEHELPIVTTSGPGLVPLLADAVMALRPDDPTALARAVLAVGSDAGLRQRLRAGSRRVAGAASWDHIAARHAEVYAALPA